MAADAGRYEIDPNGMHPDHEKHILLFDLIYCCASYGLLQSINYVTPKTGERKLIQERKEKAQELAAALDEAKVRLDLLNEAKIWLNETLKPGLLISHKSFGEGSILQANEEAIIVQFPNIGQKKLGTIAVVGNNLIRFCNVDIQADLLNYQDILRKDEQIRNEVNWVEKNLIPYAEYLS